MATRVVSEVQKINSAIDDVYAFLSNFAKFGSMFEMAAKMGAGQQQGMPEIASKIKDVILARLWWKVLVKWDCRSWRERSRN